MTMLYEKKLKYSAFLIKLETFTTKPIIYKAKESSLIPEDFLIFQLLQKLYIYK